MRRANVRYTVDLRAIYERDGGKCAVCHKPVEMWEATLDHIVPSRFGGSDSQNNLRIAHGPCNTSRRWKPAQFPLPVLPDVREPVMRITFPTQQCRQCGWSWTPRKATPVACPNCGSRRWAEPLSPIERSLYQPPIASQEEERNEAS